MSRWFPGIPRELKPTLQSCSYPLLLPRPLREIPPWPGRHGGRFALACRGSLLRSVSTLSHAERWVVITRSPVRHFVVIFLSGICNCTRVLYISNADELIFCLTLMY
jgi:hypothetical protein